MDEAHNADQLNQPSAEEDPVPEGHSSRINRRELRFLGGMIMLLLGAAALVTGLSAPLYPDASEGWLLIVASVAAASGLLLIGSGMTGRAARLGEAVYVATPGVCLPQ
jgi:hypothetical protein